MTFNKNNSCIRSLHTVKLSSEQIKDIAALREKLHERLMQLHEELEETNLNIAVMDAALKQSSFVKASEYAPQDEKPEINSKTPAGTSAEVIAQTADARVVRSVTETNQAAPARPDTKPAGPAPKHITTTGGSPLGSMYVYPDKIAITLDDAVSIKEETPPFRTFFLDRILGEMKKKDVAEVEAGRLPSDSVISYNVDSSGGRISKITITNYRTDERSREIDSTVRWILNRMLEHAG